MLQQFSFQLKIFVKRLDKSVNVFYLRFCRLLKEPKRPIRTEGFVSEFLGKPRTGARQVSGSITAHPRPNQRAYPSHNREVMVCKVSVKNYFDIQCNWITLTYFGKTMI